MSHRSKAATDWCRASACLLSFLALAGCGTDTPTAPARVPTTVAVSAVTLSFASLGATEQLTATVVDQDGVTMSGASVAWTSSATSVATVSSTGLVTAVDNGTATITATAGAASASTSVTVAQAADSMVLAPAFLVMPGPGSSDTLTASVLDPGGSTIASAVLAWTSDDDATATVDSAGLVTAIAAGTATVTVEATVGEETLTRSLPVLVNETLQITTATLPNGDKNLDYGSESLVATGGGGDYTWTVAEGAIPTGLSLATNGDITGTPTAVDTSTFTVEVVSGDGQTAQRVLSLTINDSRFLLATDLCSANPADAIVTFEDAAFEAAVRSGLGLTAGDELTCAVASALDTVRAPQAGVASLMGAQNLPGLTYLGLFQNVISDLSPLAGLTNLTYLNLSDSPTGDVSALRDLTNLTFLNLGGNGIADITPLSTLTNLTELFLEGNGFSDISALSALVNLEVLHLFTNPIADISVLEGLTNLRDVALFDNFTLGDIQPLIDNVGLGTGDTVDIRDVSPTLPCSDVALLQAKGVTVTFNVCS